MGGGHARQHSQMREGGSTEHGGSSDTSADATSFADGEREGDANSDDNSERQVQCWIIKFTLIMSDSHFRFGLYWSIFRDARVNYAGHVQECYAQFIHYKSRSRHQFGHSWNLSRLTSFCAIPLSRNSDL